MQLNCSGVQRWIPRRRQSGSHLSRRQSGVGKSIVALNLASAFAQDGYQGNFGRLRLLHLHHEIGGREYLRRAFHHDCPAALVVSIANAAAKAEPLLDQDAMARPGKPFVPDWEDAGAVLARFDLFGNPDNHRVSVALAKSSREGQNQRPKRWPPLRCFESFRPVRAPYCLV